jgi:hypothetical protein
LRLDNPYAAMKKSVRSSTAELGGVAGVSSGAPGGNTYFVRQHEQSHRKCLRVLVTIFEKERMD